jgi:hypothetical protein
MANTVNKATIYNALLDEIIVAGLTSAPLTAAASRVRYDGGNTIKIAKISTDGFGDYNRATGFPGGSATLDWETHVIRQDRGVSFNVDVMDEDETLQTLSATNVINDFARVQAVPEIDAYRYSNIFLAIVDDSTVRYSYYTPAAATILSTIQDEIGDIQNIIGEQEPLVCFMSGAAFKVLTKSTELSKELMVQNVSGPNGITSKTYEIDGVQIIPVPSARMKTEYEYYDGTTQFGFAAKAWAQEMNWIITSRNAVAAFVKHSKMKIFSADVNQSADAELVQAREYHDCWVYENKHNTISISLKTATIASIDDVGGDVDAESGNIEITLGDAYTNRDTGHTFWYIDTNSDVAPTAPNAYDEFDTSGYTELTTAAETDVAVAADDYAIVVELDENNRVIAYTAVAALA